MTVDPLAQRRRQQGRGEPPHRPLTLVGTHPPVVPQPHEQANRWKPTKGGVIATLSGVPRYDTLEIRGTIQGQR
jgi:hypothetical protein